MTFQFSDEELASAIEREKIETFAQLTRIIEESCDKSGRLKIYIAASIPKSSRICILSNGEDPDQNIIEANKYFQLYRFEASKYFYEKRIVNEKIFVLSTEKIKFHQASTAKVMIRNLIAFVLTSRQALLRNKVVDISYASSE